MKTKEINWKAVFENQIKAKLEVLQEIAQQLSYIEEEELWRDEAGSFKNYCLKWGLNPEQIEIILATPQIYEDIKNFSDFPLFACPELLKPFMNLDRDDRTKLAVFVMGKDKPITTELINEVKAGLFGEHMIELLRR